MQKSQNLEEGKTLLKVIVEEKTCIKAKYRYSTDFALTKSNKRSQRRFDLKKKSLKSCQSVRNVPANIELNRHKST